MAPRDFVAGLVDRGHALRIRWKILTQGTPHPLKRNRPHFSRACAALITGVLLLGLMLLVHVRKARPAGLDSQIAALEAERKALVQRIEAERAALPARTPSARGTPWSRGQLAEFTTEIGRGWRCDIESGQDPEHATLHRASAELGAWFEALAALGRLAGERTVIVESLEAQASGDRRRRRFTRLELGIRLVQTDPRASIDARTRDAAASAPDTLPQVPTHPLTETSTKPEQSIKIDRTHP
jgi:hypothetical protein